MMLNPIQRGPFLFALANSLGQLWQQVGEILLDGNVYCVIQGILKMANDIELYITIMALVIIWSENFMISPFSN